MKQNINKLIFGIFFCFLFVINFTVVIAQDLSGKGSSGSNNEATQSGTGNWTLGADPDKIGIRIALTNGTRSSSNVAEWCSFHVSKSSLIANGFSNANYWWSREGKIQSSYLYSFLGIPYGSNSGNYGKLLELIKGNCDSSKIQDNSYIYVEPYATRGGVKYTLHQLLISGIQTNDGMAARKLATAATTGVKVGVYASVPSGSECTENYWYNGVKCGIAKFGGNGYGVTEIKASEVIPTPNTYTMTIVKMNSQEKAMSDVRFTLDVNGTVYSSKTNTSGVATFSNLPPLTNGNTYKLTEILPSGYDPEKSIIYWDYDARKGRGKDGTDNMGGVYWNINTLNSDRTVVIVNEKTCISEFNAIDKNNLNERIRLYNTYSTYNNLLNLGELQADKACAPKACNQSINPGCLAVSNSQSASNDFSCYDFNVNVSGSNANVYCITNFALQNLFSGSPSNGAYQFGKDYSIFSGRLINKDANKAEAAQLNLDIYCYSSSNLGDYLSIGKTFGDFVSEVKFNGEVLSYPKKNEYISLKTQGAQYGGYIYSLNSVSNFNFPKIYSHIGDGKIKYNLNSSSDYRFLGYGIISELNARDEQFIDYSVSLGEYVTKLDIYTEDNNKSDGETYVDGVYKNYNQCSYIPDNEITIPPPGESKLNLEFRIIDATTTEATKIFPGKNGIGRKIGSNWCLNNTSCSSNIEEDENNRINLTPITTGTNSYGYIPGDASMTRQAPKYTIILDSKTIGEIREYNKEENHEYDADDLTCDDSYNCTSDFLNNKEKNIWNSTNLIRG